MPIKRNPALIPLSHDHHQGLLLCWKLNKGLREGVDPGRMMAYARFFFNEELEIHFKEEEEYLFPIIGLEDHDVGQAMVEHEELRRFFLDEKTGKETCSRIARMLKGHIRFEERILFNKIQDKAGKEELQVMHQKLHSRPAKALSNRWDDPFWG